MLQSRSRSQIAGSIRLGALLLIGLFLGSAVTAYAFERQPHMQMALGALNRNRLFQAVLLP